MNMRIDALHKLLKSHSASVRFPAACLRLPKNSYVTFFFVLFHHIIINISLINILLINIFR